MCPCSIAWIERELAELEARVRIPARAYIGELDTQYIKSPQDFGTTSIGIRYIRTLTDIKRNDNAYISQKQYICVIDMFNSIRKEKKREYEKMLRRFKERDPNKPDFALGESRGKLRHAELEHSGAFRNSEERADRFLRR